MVLCLLHFSSIAKNFWYEQILTLVVIHGTPRPGHPGSSPPSRAGPRLSFGSSQRSRARGERGWWRAGGNKRPWSTVPTQQSVPSPLFGRLLWAFFSFWWEAGAKPPIAAPSLPFNFYWIFYDSIANLPKSQLPSCVEALFGFPGKMGGRSSVECGL